MGSESQTYRLTVECINHYAVEHSIIWLLMMIMMVLSPKAGSSVFMPPGDEMSEVASHCLPLRQLWVSNLSKVTTQWLEVDSNLRPFGCKAENIPLDPRVSRRIMMNLTKHNVKLFVQHCSSI